MDLLGILFPKRCVDCGKIGKYFCKKCAGKIKFIIQPICPICERASIDGVTHPRCRTKYSIDGLTSFFYYDGAVRKAVKLLKYRFVTDLAKEFVDLIPSSSFQSAINNRPSTIFLPIPLHKDRLKFRGFNQAEVLGTLLARKLNIPVRTNIIVRIKKTTPQVEMKDRKKRLQNMENVFAITPNILVSRYPNIILFDDVFTTGATLRSAANMLKRKGARNVWGITLAHG